MSLIQDRFAEITPRAMRKARDDLEAHYEFAADQSSPYGHRRGDLVR